MSALLLTRRDIEALLDAATLAGRLRSGFIAYSADVKMRALRARAAVPGSTGSATVQSGRTIYQVERVEIDIDVHRGHLHAAALTG
jgi:hypothetical protein